MTRLETSEDFDALDPDTRQFMMDECGPGRGHWISKLVPETILGVNVTSVCGVHDVDYTIRTENPWAVNARFRRNLIHVIDAHGGPLRIPRKAIAWVWWAGVMVAAPFYWRS